MSSHSNASIKCKGMKTLVGTKSLLILLHQGKFITEQKIHKQLEAIYS